MPRDEHGNRVMGRIEREDRAYRRRVLAVDDVERAAIRTAIENDGVDGVIDEVAGWVRLLLSDPDAAADGLPLGATLQRHWRATARSLKEDGYRRPAEGARHVRELLRHDLDLRSRHVRAPQGMDLVVVDDLLRVRADMTAEQLADVAGLRWPPRLRTTRARRPPAPAPRPPVDPVQRQRDRDAYDRENRAWEQRARDEERRRILEGDDA